MKKVTRKYFVYLGLSFVALIVWVVMVLICYLNNIVLLLLGTAGLFLFLILSQICHPKTRLIDLNIKDIKSICWSRVLIALFIASILAYLVVYRKSGTSNVLIMTNTAAFGIVLGYFITIFDEHRKSKEEGKNLLTALLCEVSNTRYNCQAILTNTPPSLFATYVWDNFRISKHFPILMYEKDELSKQLFNVYLLISGANWRINMLSVATYNQISNPTNKTYAQVVTNADKALKNFLINKLLPKIKEVESDLQIIVSSLK